MDSETERNFDSFNPIPFPRQEALHAGWMTVTTVAWLFLRLTSKFPDERGEHLRSTDWKSCSFFVFILLNFFFFKGLYLRYYHMGTSTSVKSPNPWVNTTCHKNMREMKRPTHLKEGASSQSTSGSSPCGNTQADVCSALHLHSSSSLAIQRLHLAHLVLNN